MRLQRGISFTRPRKKVKCNEGLEIVNTYLKKNLCLPRADYCQLTGCNKRSTLKGLNIFYQTLSTDVLWQREASSLDESDGANRYNRALLSTILIRLYNSSTSSR